jgi:hypothetical protein
MTKLKAEPEALGQMVGSPYNYEDTRWAAYQNKALDSASAGHLQFLAVGPKNTLKEAPKQAPDTQHGLGWKYQFVGWVNLETGDVQEDKSEPASQTQ